MDGVNISSAGTHDEIINGVEMNGAGHTAEDVSPAAATGSGTGSASVNHRIRAERSGRGDGRVYTFTVMATFDNMLDSATPCTATFTATVPHDQRK
jgi:hypothetical protein